MLSKRNGSLHYIVHLQNPGHWGNVDLELLKYMKGEDFEGELQWVNSGIVPAYAVQCINCFTDCSLNVDRRLNEFK